MTRALLLLTMLALGGCAATAQSIPHGSGVHTVMTSARDAEEAVARLRDEADMLCGEDAYTMHDFDASSDEGPYARSVEPVTYHAEVHCEAGILAMGQLGIPVD